MSATTALIRRYYDAFNAGGDRKPMLALLSESVVHDINQGQREAGKAAFVRFLERMDRCYRERVVDLVVMATDDGGRAAAEFIIEGEYLVTDEGLPPASGQRYRLSVGAFFAIADGRITRVSNYYNLQDWLKQVGA